MISHFVKFMDDLKLFTGKTPKIRFDDAIFLGQFLKYDTKIWGLRGPKNVKILEVPKSIQKVLESIRNR